MPDKSEPFRTNKETQFFHTWRIFYRTYQSTLNKFVALQKHRPLKEACRWESTQCQEKIGIEYTEDSDILRLHLISVECQNYPRGETLANTLNPNATQLPLYSTIRNPCQQFHKLSNQLRWSPRSRFSLDRCRNRKDSIPRSKLEFKLTIWNSKKTPNLL